MAITTLTLPNGVRIETTADPAEVGHLLGTAAPSVAPAAPAEQPKAAEGSSADTQPRTQAKPAKRAKQAKPASRQPKAAKTDGKALWAAITKAVAEGNYEEARRLAAPKPDTFGVQCEAAIARHQARAAKRAKQAKPASQPKRKSALPPKGEQVEVKRVTPKAMAEAIDAKARAAAEAADQAYDNEQPTETPKASRKRNHKPDCGCPTCPKGIAARKAQAQAKQPKAEKQAKPAKQQPKAQPKAAEVAAEQEAAAMQREAERILAKSLEQAESLARALDLAGLKEATRQCLVLANRNERLGRPSLYEAYRDAADLFQDALAEAQANTLA